MNKRLSIPELPLQAWEKSKITLHLILQIFGKVRLNMTPRKNHWWFITEYVSSRGFTTSHIPCGDGINTFEINYNVHASQVEIFTSLNTEKIIPLYNGLSVASFYKQIMKALDELNIHPKIIDKPFDMGINKRFAEIEEYHHYDEEYVKRFWKIMLWVDGVFNEFSGRFYGKTCPVQLYWHHMDLAVTRFSGKKAPPMDPSARISDKDAYSHEVISFGFWAGDDNVREPAFYAYAYPSPDGIDKIKLLPQKAVWIDSNGSPMAFYRYNDLLKEENPREALLVFLESTYQAGAKLAGWDIEELKTIDLDKL